jgi:hemerythrin-like domain-containing protein
MRPLSLTIIRDEHQALAAMLRSLPMLLQQARRENKPPDFSVVRAMLFYIDEFPERLHHPKESNLLFPKVARRVPALMPVIERLEREHMGGEHAVRDLQHLLLAWELLGDTRRQAFQDGFTRYVNLYLAHMQLEEQEILPAAEKHLSEADWQALDAAFEQNCDPLTGRYKPDPVYEQLFSRIVRSAPAPIGLGEG